MTVKEMVMAKETVGYISACGGIEIKEIMYGIDDHVVFIAHAWGPNTSAHKRKSTTIVMERILSTMERDINLQIL